MSARDKVFGRQGGRIVEWVEMTGDAVHIVCRCGYSEAGRLSVGKLCQVCWFPQREMDDVDWRIRRYERARRLWIEGAGPDPRLLPAGNPGPFVVDATEEAA